MKPAALDNLTFYEKTNRHPLESAIKITEAKRILFSAKFLDEYELNDELHVQLAISQDRSQLYFKFHEVEGSYKINPQTRTIRPLGAFTNFGLDEKVIAGTYIPTQDQSDSHLFYITLQANVE